MARCCIYLFFCTQFFGINLFGFMFSYLGTFLMQDSNINKYDFYYIYSSQYNNQLFTPTFNLEYFVTDRTLDELSSLRDTKNDEYIQFEKNMEQHLVEWTGKQCDAAKFEKNRLIKRANHFMRRPDKKEEILHQAHNLKELIYCEKLDRIKEKQEN